MPSRSLAAIASLLLAAAPAAAETVTNATIVKLEDGKLTIKLANGKKTTLPLYGGFTAKAPKRPGGRPELIRDVDRFRLLETGNVITYSTGDANKVLSVLNVTLVRGTLADDEALDALLAANPGLVPKKDMAKLKATRSKAEAEKAATAAFLRGEDAPEGRKEQPQKSPDKVIEGTAKVERGKITIKPMSGGAEVTYPVGLNLRGIDLEGKVYEGPFAARLLGPDNVLAFGIGTVLGQESVIELRLLKGTVAELKPTRPQGGSTVFDGAIHKDDWDRYYKTASVGDFVEYRDPDFPDAPPARVEIVEVGKDYVVESRVVYFFGVAGSESRFKLKFDPQLSSGRPDKSTTVTAKVVDKELSCQLVEKRIGGADSEIYLRRLSCAEVPFDGVVREQLHGKLQKNLIRYRWAQRTKD